eukprot:5463033-Pyramimonas_sp.AAC.1
MPVGLHCERVDGGLLPKQRRKGCASSIGEDDGARIVRTSPSSRCLGAACGPSCRCTDREASPRPNE